MPAGWLSITTHRLDIYEEKLAKTQFLERFEVLFDSNNSDAEALIGLPSAYDYIRLGHPLSCLLEWVVAKGQGIPAKSEISFSSKTMPVLAILRKNSLEAKNTQIVYTDELPVSLELEVLRSIYDYKFDLRKIEKLEEIETFEGSTVFISEQEKIANNDLISLPSGIDFFVGVNPQLGSVILVNGEQNDSYISQIQHVRRRETIAMTPANCHTALRNLVENTSTDNRGRITESNKAIVIDSIKGITGADTKVLVGSSGLSIQYAILMGLIHNAREEHKGRQ